jgi:hypothetical protein
MLLNSIAAVDGAFHFISPQQLNEYNCSGLWYMFLLRNSH